MTFDHRDALVAGDAVACPVAIIGMAGRFPGADDVATFWDHLTQGVESISRFPAPDPALAAEPRFVGTEGALDGIELFDASFFGYSPREAALMDPQHRVALEVAWHAFEDAGYDPKDVPGSVGVFLGAGISSYLVRNLLPRHDLVKLLGGFRFLIHNDKDFAATTLAYKLGLTGPAMAVGTACSSSLVAVHLACQSLQAFESDLVIAGGASIQVPQRQGYVHSDDSIYSPDGRCRPFDALAAGTVGGSGVAAVVLKRLDDATRDSDRVHAVIAGSAVNNDGGGSVGYTAPSVDGQLAVITEALTVSGVPADSIGYLEAHGTGTPLGDSIEIDAATRAFRISTQRSQYCAVGSVKANVGHLDAAAGVTGLLKAALAVKNGLIPPHPSFTAPNPHIAFDDTPFHVNREALPWHSSGVPRTAGVSSFGIGGTNAHVIIREPPPQRPGTTARVWQVVAVSARSVTALREASDAVAARLDGKDVGELAAVAATLATRRSFAHRRAVICREAAAAIDVLTAGEPVVAEAGPRHEAEDSAPAVAFLFPGQGAQHAGMAAQLYYEEPAFAAHLDECADWLGREGIDVVSAIRRPGDAGEPHPLDNVVVGQSALFAVEYALAQSLIGWGLRPCSVVGHSIGEYVAATVAGALPLTAALRLVVGRARLLETSARGAMLAVRISEEELLDWLNQGSWDAVSLAAVNAADTCVISGPRAEMDEVATQLRRRDAMVRPLPSGVAFHSALVDPVLADFARLVEEVDGTPARLPWVSTLTGDWVPQGGVVEPAHWVCHLRQTVRFEAALRRLFAEGDGVLLEVGPGTTLSTIARRHPQCPEPRHVLACQPRPSSGESQQAALLKAVATAWTAGCDVDLTAVQSARTVQRADCPLYPFQRERHWIDAPDAAPAPSGQWESQVAWLRERYDKVAKQQPIRTIGSYPGLRSGLDELCAAMAIGYLASALSDTAAGARCNIKSVRERLRVRPEFERMVDYLVDVLAEDGVVDRQGETIAFGGRNGQLDAEKVAARLRRDYPDFAGVVDLLMHCARHYRTGLSVRGAARGVLYPDGQGDLLRRTLGDDTVEFSVTGRLTRLVADLVRELAASTVPRPLRVLEVGAGGGRLTWEVAESLRGTTAEYLVTDIGRTFVGYLDREAAARDLSIHTGLLDICRDPAEQGLTGQTFDVVVGLDVVHATSDVPRALEHLQGLVAPDGTLALIETVAGDRWLNLVWGLAEEWWSFTDGLRARTPLLRPDQWRSVVTAADFADPVIIPDGDTDAVAVFARAAAKSAPSRDRLVTNDLVKLPDASRWAHLPGWSRGRPVTAAAGDLPERSTALVFSAGLPGDAVAQRLRERDLPVVVVRPGAQTAVATGLDVTIDPKRPEDYRRVVDHVAAQYGPIAVVAHLWNTGPVPDGSRLETLDETQRLGIFSLLSIAKALADAALGQQVRIVAVTTAAQDVLGDELLAPERSTLYAATKVIPREYPQLSCAGVDVPSDADPGWLAERVLAELATPADDPVVAYRGSSRWLPSFTPWRLAKAPTRPTRPRPGGVYLVCGGLGGIGLTLAEELARLPAAVVLTRRTPFPPRDAWDRWLTGHPADDRTSGTIRRLRQIEECGGEVQVDAADITSLPDMHAVVDRAVHRFGGITGVIHAAGVLDTAGMIHRRSVAETWEAIASKVRGAFVLEEVLRDQDLEFAVYCSSIGSVLYKLKFGEVGYVAGNEFLNAFAAYRTARGDPATIAIAWTDWLEDGMWTEARKQLEVRYAQPAVTSGLRPTDDLLRGLTSAEGVEVFRRLLADPPAPTMVISTVDLQDLLTRHDAFTRADHVQVLETMRLSMGTRPRPEVGSAYQEPRTESERVAVAICESLLGVDGVGVHDDFFALGGDSLIALRFLARLRDELGVRRTVSDLFQSPTIAALLDTGLGVTNEVVL